MSWRFGREDDQSIRLNFGKHQGECLQDIPDSYLWWLEENIEDDELLDEVREELSYRESTGTIIRD
ncbi:MAG: DUF3820 family protein [Deltaproteobacteria bacterium]|nr:DUF3820 family protein [Deltaproteobacteria bacterium]